MHRLDYLLRAWHSGNVIISRWIIAQLNPFNDIVVVPQNVTDIVLLSIICLLLFGILVALQFPTVLNSPFAALAFAIVTTGSLGTAAAIVGGHIAPLPLYALILVKYSYILCLYYPKLRTVSRK